MRPFPVDLNAAPGAKFMLESHLGVPNLPAERQTTKRILVTGATGFIGRHVVRALLDDGRDLRLTARDEAACPPEWRTSSRIELCSIDDLAVDEVRPMVADVDAVVHLAGLAGGSSEAEALFERANVAATERLARAGRSGGVRTFIHMSSVMAVSPNVAGAMIDDSAVPAPVTAYGRSKRRSEEVLRQIFSAGRFGISLRPPLVIGGDAKGNWARLQALAASGLPLPFASVAALRSLMPVTFLAASIVQLCRIEPEPRLSGEYCIAARNPVHLAGMIRQLRAGMGLPPRLFRCPPGLLHAVGAATGLRRQLASLSGPLRVDPSRFLSTFNMAEDIDVEEAIRRSGAAYRVLRSGRKRGAVTP
jgi:UDP-glucose 4-epimerase